MTQTISRKELAGAIGVSERTLKRKESKWGLRDCRSTSTTQPIQYLRDKASAILIRHKVIERAI